MKDFKSLLELTNRFPTEKSCHKFLANHRWGDNVACPHCQSTEKIYRIESRNLYKCGKCVKQFSVKVGTIFEDSALPLQKWFMAIYLITAHRKGVSSLQLSRDIGVTQKTAWFMLHRIRYAVRSEAFDRTYGGTVEVDESYIGGKPRHGKIRNPNADGTANKRGLGTTKTPVVGIVQREGGVVAQSVTDTRSHTLKAIIRKHVKPGSRVMTDEWRGYQSLKAPEYFHHFVNHSEKEYVRGKIHTNTIESFWALLKRSITGIYHQVSPKHLDKYVDECEFRWNQRHTKDPKRLDVLLWACNGRLTYKTLITK